MNRAAPKNARTSRCYSVSSDMASLSPATHRHTFYRKALASLTAASVEFLVGGAFAFRCYTGIERDTNDFDIMLRPRDVPRALTALRAAGYRAGYTFTHWLAKAHL